MSSDPAPGPGTTDVSTAASSGVSTGASPGAARTRRSRTPQGPTAPAAVQKLRIRYSKRDRLRYTSTRDFQRAFERALRRADVPMAFSSGFHPHPRISYANAAPTGTASEAEYAEIAVVERLDPQAVKTALDDALPPGYGIEAVAEAAPGSLADLLEASLWRCDFGELDPTQSEHLREAVAKLLATDEVLVTRILKKGPRTFDARAALLRASWDSQASPCAILNLVVRHTTPVVRPDDVLTAMRSVVDLRLPHPVRVTRLAQGPLEPATASVGDPLTAVNVDGVGLGGA